MTLLEQAATATTPSRWSVVRLVPWAVGLLACIVAPFYVYPVFLTKTLCFCLFACAFNLVARTTGLLSFGHAAFFGSAAYTAGYAAKAWGVPFELAVLIGTGTGFFLGLVMGVISVQRQGLYFAMITLALAQLVYFIAFQLPFTHADDGLTGIPRGHLLGFIDLNNNIVMYYTTLFVFLVGLAIIYRVINSPFGRILRAIRDNQPRAISLGYSVDTYKILRLCHFGSAVGNGGSDQGNYAADRHDVRSSLGGFRRRSGHGAARGHRDAAGASRWRRHYHLAARLSGGIGAAGASSDRGDLRLLYPALSQRHRRRAEAAAQALAIVASALTRPGTSSASSISLKTRRIVTTPASTAMVIILAVGSRLTT